MFKIKVIVIFIFTISLSAEAQQLPLLSQYMFNGFLVNPAVAGVDGYTSVTLTAREQWLGIKDAPKTHIVAVQGRILKNNFVSRNKSIFRRFVRKSRSGKVGLGGYLYNDRNGLIDRTGGQFTYAYHLKVNSIDQLSFGVSTNIYQYHINRNQLELENEDAFVDNSNLKMYVPDFSFGTYYTSKYYYAGFSISNLMQSSIQLANDNSSQFRTYRQYAFTAGYSFELKNDVVIVPSMYLKVTNQLVAQVDISTKVYFNEQYYAGLSFRTGSAFIVMGGVTIEKFSVGLAYDYNLNAISQHSFGSFELMAAMKFGDSARRYRWINRY